MGSVYLYYLPTITLCLGQSNQKPSVHQFNLTPVDALCPWFPWFHVSSSVPSSLIGRTSISFADPRSPRCKTKLNIETPTLYSKRWLTGCGRTQLKASMKVMMKQTESNHCSFTNPVTKRMVRHYCHYCSFQVD